VVRAPAWAGQRRFTARERNPWSVIPVDRTRGESGHADGDVLRAVRSQSAVTHPFPGPGMNSLAGLETGNAGALSLPRAGLTGARAALVVMLAVCQSPVRNPGRNQVQGPCSPTGPPTTPPSRPSCGWLPPIPSSSCANARLAAATTASPAVECRPTRPVRADPPPKTIRTTTDTITGTTTNNRLNRQRNPTAITAGPSPGSVPTWTPGTGQRSRAASSRRPQARVRIAPPTTSAAIVPASHSQHHAARQRKVIPARIRASATASGLLAAANALLIPKMSKNQVTP
jgi:hypothetical protein